MQHVKDKNINVLSIFVIHYLDKTMYGQPVDIYEKYAHDIFSRVVEIDDAMVGLKISLEYISEVEFSSTSFTFSELHSFHVENFLIRLTSVVDRSLKLSGVVLGMEDSIVDGHNGNREIKKKLKLCKDNISPCIERIEKIVSVYKKERNKIVHYSGYSNKNLTALTTLESLTDEEKNNFKGLMSPTELKNIVVDDIREPYKLIIKELNSSIEALISSLNPIFSEYLIAKNYT
ncbi:Cthe_2314 family HEPN domain-containing protein [Vibrio splendidus]